MAHLTSRPNNIANVANSVLLEKESGGLHIGGRGFRPLWQEEYTYGVFGSACLNITSAIPPRTNAAFDTNEKLKARKLHRYAAVKIWSLPSFDGSNGEVTRYSHLSFLVLNPSEEYSDEAFIQLLQKRKVSFQKAILDVYKKIHPDTLKAVRSNVPLLRRLPQPTARA